MRRFTVPPSWSVSVTVTAGQHLKAGHLIACPAASLVAHHTATQQGRLSNVAAATRDPVSETLDRAARALLERVYKADGAWASTRLRDPTPAQLARWLTHGINVLGRDPVQRG